MSAKVFHEECRAKWVSAISSAVGPTPPTTSIWDSADEIVAAIAPFADATNHLLFPVTGGGMDVARVAVGQEPGTIEFIVDDSLAYLAKPKMMTLEYISSAPAQSFVIIDLAPLRPSGVYPADRQLGSSQWNEEVVELPSGDYVERDVLDVGYIGHDAAGHKIPVPDEARLVIRILGGRLMLITKGSFWNSIPETYNGTHDRMTNQQIRTTIERWISSAVAAG